MRQLVDLHPRGLVVEVATDDGGRVVVRRLAPELLDEEPRAEHDLDAELLLGLAHGRVRRLLAGADLAARKVEVGVSVANAADQRDTPLVAEDDSGTSAHSFSRRLSSAAQRESVGCSSCVCGSLFRFLPQTGQSPAQSARQRILSGVASATASRAHAARSRLSSWRYGVRSSSDPSGFVA